MIDARGCYTYYDRAHLGRERAHGKVTTGE